MNECPRCGDETETEGCSNVDGGEYSDCDYYEECHECGNEQEDCECCGSCGDPGCWGECECHECGAMASDGENTGGLCDECYADQQGDDE